MGMSLNAKAVGRRLPVGDAITFGSVCSGIEAASVAWQPLGWRCSFMSEIEPFPHGDPGRPNFRFCDAPITRLGASYCEPCRLICYQPMRRQEAA